MSWQAVKAAIKHRCPSATAKAVLLVVAEHAHEDGTGSCASIKTIAAESDANERTVRHILAVLVAGGILSDDESAGRRGWAVNMGEPVDLRGTPMRKAAAPTPAKAAPTPAAPTPAEPAPSSNKAAPTPAPSEPPINHHQPPTLVLVGAEPQPVDDDAAFDEFWSTYPRRVSKGAARKAWRAARKKATAQELLLGAARYRDDPTRKPEFTAYPASWLNGERWLDEASALRPAVSYDTTPVVYR